MDAVENIANGLALTFEDGLEADPLVALGRGYVRDVAESRKSIEQVNISHRPRAGFDAGSFGDEGYAPAMLVQVLFPLQAMAADRNSVIGSVEDVGVIQLAYGLQLLQHT